MGIRDSGYDCSINNEDRKKFYKKKCWNLLNFVTSKELSEKSTFLQIAAPAFEAGDFLNIFLILSYLEKTEYVRRI